MDRSGHYYYGQEIILQLLTKVLTENMFEQAEIERLRKEGSKQVEEEIELVRKQVQQDTFYNSSKSVEDPNLFRLKVTWNMINNEKNTTYNQDSLTKIFSKVS